MKGQHPMTTDLVPVAMAPESVPVDAAFPPYAKVSTTNPAVAYVASLAPGSRRSMEGALQTIAETVAGMDANYRDFPWHLLRAHHTAAIRSQLAERYGNAATCNRILAALRGTLRNAWRIGLLDSESCER